MGLQRRKALGTIAHGTIVQDVVRPYMLLTSLAQTFALSIIQAHGMAASECYLSQTQLQASMKMSLQSRTPSSCQTASLWASTSWAGVGIASILRRYGIRVPTSPSLTPSLFEPATP